MVWLLQLKVTFLVWLLLVAPLAGWAGPVPRAPLLFHHTLPGSLARLAVVPAAAGVAGML